MRSFSTTSRTTCALNSSEYFTADMVSILSTQGKKNSPARNTPHTQNSRLVVLPREVVKCGVGAAWCLGVGEASGVSRVVSSHLVIEPDASVVQDRGRRWMSS